MTRDRLILTLNAGSSSLKFALFAARPDLALRIRGEIESIDRAPRMQLFEPAGICLWQREWASSETPDFSELLRILLQEARDHLGGAELAAVGHRVVHGGIAHIDPERITADIIISLEALVPLDPLHEPHNLAPMRAIASIWPEVTQVACFDTAFHHTLPAVANRYALPATITDAGVRAFGFHGLSYEFIAETLKETAPQLAEGRVVVAHLGSGASLCALDHGRSIATTMGFSTLDGLVMATRCGRLDPGVIFHLARQGVSLPDIETMLYRQSGLLGISGISGDIRKLLASHAPKAQLAIDLFTYRIAYEACGLVSALGGLDGIVFTAGIGQHSADIRARICDRLAWLGVKLDTTRNAMSASVISTEDSAVDVRVIATDEELMIARHTWDLMPHDR